MVSLFLKSSTATPLPSFCGVDRLSGIENGPDPFFPGAPISAVHVGNVLPAQELHHSRNAARLRWCCQKMDMIGHQHIHVNRHVVAQRRLAQIGQIKWVIRHCEETRLTIIAALNHVLRHIGKIGARLPRLDKAPSWESPRLAQPSPRRYQTSPHSWSV